MLIWLLIAAFLPLQLLACGESDEERLINGRLVIHRGDNQTSSAGTKVATPPEVRVLDADGKGLEGITVSFFVGLGEGSISPNEVLTNEKGIAALKEWKLGKEGQNSVVATAGNFAVTFHAHALSSESMHLVKNPDFSAETGSWDDGSGPEGWLVSMAVDGNKVVVEKDSERGNVLRFDTLGEHFGETRLDQCISLAGAADLTMAAWVKVSHPHDDLRLRLNADLYESEEDCLADESSERVGTQTRTDFKLGPAENLAPKEWRVFSAPLNLEVDAPSYARISLRARDRSGIPSDRPKLLIDRFDVFGNFTTSSD